MLNTQYKCLCEREDWDKFENYVWCTLYKMGFTEMNGNNFRIKTGPSTERQIDVFVKSNNFICIFECKTSKSKPDLKKDIVDFASNRSKSNTDVINQFKKSPDDKLELA